MALCGTTVGIFGSPPGGIDSLLRGLISRPAKLGTQDHMMVNALREQLFQFVEHVAMDLGALNMQRGRDHGLPGEARLRSHLPPPSHEASFLTELMSSLVAVQDTTPGANSVA